ncbi:MAG: response regulator [Ectothiorhodospiraceae bacterium]|nr:response regulator [Ectothiorhodospiraceae bacterium]
MTHRDDIATGLGLSPSEVLRRTTALGISETGRARLRAVWPRISATVEQDVHALHARFRLVPELASLLTDERVVARLEREQREYVASVFEASIGWDYVLDRIRIGVAHHRAGLPPQWFLCTYAHIVGDRLPALLDRADPDPRAVEDVATLISTVLFDATIVLDAYGMAETLHRQEVSRQHAALDAVAAAPETRATEGARSAERRPPLAGARLTQSAVDTRRNFLGLGEPQIALLRELGTELRSAMPEILAEFYQVFSQHPETAALVPQATVERLMRQVASFWEEFFRGSFDRPYATSRIRVGVVHERIGLTPQWYLVGLAHQVAALLRRGAAAFGARFPAVADAFLRGVFFDLAYVLDAYMEARAESALRTEGYANQLVAGLSSGVAVIDQDRRVLSVNQQLLEFLRAESAMVYRLPVERALPIPELGGLLDRVGVGPGQHGRQATVGRLGRRLLRLTAILLDGWDGVRGRPIALVVDDISDLVRVVATGEEDSARLATIIDSVELTVWEMDPATWTIELVSEPVLELTGFRDVFFIGRREAWLSCLPERDRERFKAYCKTLPESGRGSLAHRFVRADGREIWVRTSLRLVRAAGEPVLFGATVDITNEHVARERGRQLALAEERERTKSEILATMSHEIRTPLNGVIGMLDFLLESRLEAGVVPHIRTAQQSALELLDLLTDILDLSKLEAGRMVLHLARFDLAGLLEGVRDLFHPRALDKGIELRLSTAADLPSAWTGDAPRIRQILVNLVNNAIKFTDHGAITMRVERVSTGIRLVVEDTGIGVPEDRRDELFQPFTQIHRSQGGTGLGLSICQWLARLMGGDIAFAPATGGGSRFSVELPLAPAPPAELPAGHGRRVGLVLFRDGAEALAHRLTEAGWAVEWGAISGVSVCFLDDPDLVDAVAPEIPLVLCAPLQPGRRIHGRMRLGVLSLNPLNEARLIEILSDLGEPRDAPMRFQGAALIAEDNLVNQRVLALMLEKLGFDVDTVVNGSLAVDAASKRTYALVLMDMLMPEMNGLEATRRIRQGVLNRNTPIIAITANVQEEDRRECLSAGMDEVLVKPLQLGSLRAAVARHARAS